MKLHQMTFINKTMNILQKILFSWLCLILSGLSMSTAFGQTDPDSINTLPHYDLRPELLDRNDPPNIMIIFDNSGSMGWDLNGRNVGAGNIASRSTIARAAMAQVFDDLVGKVNLGLSVYGWDASTNSCNPAATHWGSLRANIAPFDNAANASFQRLLARETFNNRRNINELIRSSGCTPISGSLQTVIDYVDPLADLIDSRNPNGITPVAPPSLQCSAQNAVILVTDGQANSNNTTIGCNSTNATFCSQEKVAELDELMWETYVIGFGQADNLAASLNIIASGSVDEKTGNARSFIPASNGDDLVQAFTDILSDIFSRTSSGSVPAVSTSSNQDSGFFVQAAYRPLVEGIPHNGNGDVLIGDDNAFQDFAYWSGSSRLLFLDPLGFVREDTNNDQIFDVTDYGADKAIQIETSGEGTTVFRRLNVTIDDNGEPIPAPESETNPINELNSLWELSDSLNDLYQVHADDPSDEPLNDGEVKMTNDMIQFQRTGSSFEALGTDHGGRLIFTNIDGELRDFTFSSGQPGNFGEAPIQSSEIGYLGLTATETDRAKNLIDWVRGADDQEDNGNLRNRTVLSEVRRRPDSNSNDSELSLEYNRLLLGDAIHSAPVVVGPPSESFFELYGDVGYQQFRDNNSDRRTIAYIGTNDGMIHAVNTGKFDPITLSFDRDGFPLGFEMWAFIPESILPHLRFMASSTYTANNHVYGIDGPVIVKDVKVANNGNANDWRTYLFASTGYGGFNHQVDKNLSGGFSVDEILTPSIVVLDVTDPEVPPVFITELKIDPENNTPTGFGVTSVKPVVFHRNGQSFLAIGTGPSFGEDLESNDARDQKNGHYNENPSRVFIYSIEEDSVDLVDTISPGVGFVGDIATIDWNPRLNNTNGPNSDALYYGLNQGSGENNDINGRLLRSTINQGAGNVSVSEPEVLVSGFSFDHEPLLLRDQGNYWVFAGSGRVNSDEDFLSTEQNRVYGLREELEDDGSVDTNPNPNFTNSNSNPNILNVTNVGVRNSGELVGTINGSTASTFPDLVTDIAENHRGWFRNLQRTDGPSERVPGRVTNAGAGVIAHTGFLPATPNDDTQCSVVGSSFLYGYALNTGTPPWTEADAFFAEDPDALIDNGSGNLIANTLVPEANFPNTDQERFIRAVEEVENGNGGDNQTIILQQPGTTGVDGDLGPEGLNNDPCIRPTAEIYGLCAGADGTNVACSIANVGQCGFGRNSFREIDFRFFN